MGTHRGAHRHRICTLHHFASLPLICEGGRSHVTPRFAGATLPCEGLSLPCSLSAGQSRAGLPGPQAAARGPELCRGIEELGRVRPGCLSLCGGALFSLTPPQPFRQVHPASCSSGGDKYCKSFLSGGERRRLSFRRLFLCERAQQPAQPPAQGWSSGEATSCSHHRYRLSPHL